MHYYFTRLTYIIIFNVAFLSICKAQNQKSHQVIVIDNVISVTDTERTDVRDSIDWIKLPHCSKVYFKGKFDARPRVGREISISEKWKNKLGAKFDSCSTIVIIRYRGDMNFSSGGDDIACYALGDNDEIDIMKVGKSDAVLFSIITNEGEVAFRVGDWQLNLSGKDDYFSTNYLLKGVKSNIEVDESIKFYRFKKRYENSIEYGCM